MTTLLGAVRLWLERTWQDVRQAVRVIARAPGFAAIAVISIAFGTGANIAIFTTADAMLLRPLPVPRWTELVTVGTSVRRECRWPTTIVRSRSGVIVPLLIAVSALAALVPARRAARVSPTVALRCD